MADIGWRQGHGPVAHYWEGSEREKSAISICRFIALKRSLGPVTGNRCMTCQMRLGLRR